MNPSPLPPPPVTSGSPPAGTVTLKGSGWRVNLPLALVVAALTAAATRTLSTEQRAAEQARTIEVLRAQLLRCK